ncbi:hypothetical protein QQF64_021777 [Cirrhinus molitorella]|uniref:Uncharacterized protein n=1 Tax=Cirrhinus molitorella TaxID=172907 RepID=A0ABR3L9T1_9TELE
MKRVKRQRCSRHMEMMNTPDSETAEEDGEKLKGSRSGQAAMAMRQRRSASIKNSLTSRPKNQPNSPQNPISPR